MDNDRSWMKHNGMGDRRKPEYAAGVEDFLEFAFKDKRDDTHLKCPCLNCRKLLAQNRQTMKCHLFIYGIDSSYNPWTSHGESDNQPNAIREDDVEVVLNDDEADFSFDDDMASLLFEATSAFNFDTPIVNDSTTEAGSSSIRGNGEYPKELMTLVEDLDAELYPGCTSFKRLEFIISLLHIKVSNKWSDKSFSMLLNTLHKAFNHDKHFPSNAYEAKNYTKALGLDYVKIDACVNHCILFRKEFVNEEKSPKCGAPRWKEKVVQGGDNSDGEDEVDVRKTTRVPQLILRHFPLAPRLQRMFISSKLARHMRWYKDDNKHENEDDGIMRHPADSEAWKYFDKIFPDFASEPRNIRLGLASDGFNPGKDMSSRYSIWPVMLVPYNLPPWMCIKSDNMILSLLIPGPKSPGNDIDVFLQPLIDELKDLWATGVKAYDAHSKETFTMRAMLLWTINDFPAYTNLSGWSTKGNLACPNCHKHTKSYRLKHGCKWCYMDHRIWLPADHKWRVNKRAFGGKVQRDPPPDPLTGHDIMEELSGYPNVEFGKDVKGKRKRGERYIVHQWKKLSVFFQLPYWRHLLVRHNLDVMHVEKNVCESILGTILDLSGKNKDSLNARLDLESMKMHDKLRAKSLGNNKWEVPSAPYNLTLNERRKMVTFLSNLAFPDAYASNISRCVSLQDGKVMGMKTHDYHVFMQDLLTPAFQGVVDENVLEPLQELSLFFKQQCSKTLKVNDLEQMEKNIAITLCKLECVFVPAFFDVMMHLPVHLATEAKLAGPIHYRLMYRFERAMRTFRSYVRNKAHPEASIANGYIEMEYLTFCSRYMSNIETQFNRPDRNDDIIQPECYNLSVFSKIGKSLGKTTLRQMTVDERREAQLYVLKNCDEAQPFLIDYENNPSNQLNDICKWFENREEGDPRVNEELLCLARGPMKRIVTLDGYVINGFRFHTKRRQRNRKTQNSGVIVKGDEQVGEKNFYGVLEEVVVLEYDALKNRRSPNVVLFKCKWFDVFDERRGIKKGKLDSVLINVTRRLRTNESFALAYQVEQVFYVPSHNEPDWRYVTKANPRNFFDFPKDEDSQGNESLWDQVPSPVRNYDDGLDEDIPLVRNDVEFSIIEADIIQRDHNEPADGEYEEVENDGEDDEDDEDDVESEEEFLDTLSTLHDFDNDLEDEGSDNDSHTDSHSSD